MSAIILTIVGSAATMLFGMLGTYLKAQQNIIKDDLIDSIVTTGIGYAQDVAEQAVKHNAPKVDKLIVAKEYVESQGVAVKELEPRIRAKVQELKANV